MPSEAVLPDTRVFTLDVGPRNILDLAAVDALADATAPDPDRPVLILRGRLDGFCSGLDGQLLAGGPPESDRLLARMGRLLSDAVAGPTRILAVCEGHAVAAGAMLLLAADVRIAVPGNYKIGFTEPGIGMPLPELPALLARERLDRRRYHALTALGEIVGPTEARDVGFVDEVVEPDQLQPTVDRAASALSQLSERAYVGSKRAAHGDMIERVEALARAAEARARA